MRRKRERKADDEETDQCRQRSQRREVAGAGQAEMRLKRRNRTRLIELLWRMVAQKHEDGGRKTKYCVGTRHACPRAWRMHRRERIGACMRSCRCVSRSYRALLQSVAPGGRSATRDCPSRPAFRARRANFEILLAVHRRCEAR
eukprot:1414889-Pleurochrysis_carterae.AAC.1